MGDIHRVRGATRAEIKNSAITSATLSALFILVYGGCNWLTSHRSDVGYLFFEWERLIPFVPVMIIPYMSIDLFFVAAPFVCDDNDERGLLARRIAFAIVVAGVFFVTMPLRYGFSRPAPGGWVGGIYRFLHGFDRPYNLFPSLHIALRTILADTYTRHTKGPLRLAVHVWFSLIGFSTVLTYQHHVMDVVGGFVLAGFCFYIFRPRTAHAANTNTRIGFYYAAGAALSLWFAILFWPWGALFLWPAGSLFIVGAAYFGLIRNVYRKENGALPLSARVLLAPAILGQQLSLLYYKKKAGPWNEVAPGVWIGRVLNDNEAARAVQAGVTAVLDVTEEFSETKSFGRTRYINIPILDLTAPTTEQLASAVDFIRNESKAGIVYVHCKIGYSRSAAIIGAYLMSAGIAGTADEAVAHIRRARPSLIVRPEVMSVLRQFEYRKRADGKTPGTMMARKISIAE